MIPWIFKVCNNFAFLCSCLVIYTGRFNISKVSRIIVRCIFIFIVILVLCILCLIFPKLSDPSVVDVVTRLSILHYMYEVVAVQRRSTSSSILSSWLSRGWLLIIFNCRSCLRSSTVVMVIFLVVIEVARTHWLEQLPRDWHVLANQIWIGPIIKHKRRLIRLVLLLWTYKSLPCT
jgi:hypothetical protein